MWARLTKQVLRSDYALVNALEHGGAVDAVQACGITYPFPSASDDFWTTPAGVAWAQVGIEHGLAVTDMHHASEAAARVVCSSEWRSAARAAVEQRTVHAACCSELCERLVTQFSVENGSDRASAILQLAAAKAHWTYTSDTWSCYTICNAEGVVLYLRGPHHEIPTPDEPTFASMQDILNLEEQLQYLVLHDFMSPVLHRVVGQEALPCVDFLSCQTCGVNGGVDYDGNESAVLACTCCSTQAHRECGASCSMAKRSAVAPGVMCCTGLVACRGAWCLRMSQWGKYDTHIGLLHPAALACAVALADKNIETQRWVTVPHSVASVGALSGGSELRTHLLMYGHVMLTGKMPAPCSTAAAFALTGQYTHASNMAQAAANDIFPREGTLAQRPSLAACACFLTGGLVATLRALRVFHEPSFSRMCDRFSAAGATLDQVVQRWMDLKLPLLTGDIGDHGCARTMHSQMQTATISLRSRQRMWAEERNPSHWIVSQIDPVLPGSVAEDEAAMRVLGLCAGSGAKRLIASPARPDVAKDRPKRRRTTLGAHTTFPVRIMLNPSRHLKVLQQVISDAESKYTLDGALQYFLQHEIDDIGSHVTRAHAVAFRAACIRSPLYGRVFLWMTTQSYSTAPPDDSTEGLLAHADPAVQRGVPWQGGWKPVKMLRWCTGASYIDLGCGPMRYWRQVISADPTYLFEIDLASLQELAGHMTPFPDSVHVIPCSWAGLQVHDIVGPHRCAVLAAYRPGTPLPPPGDCAEMYYMLADCADYTKYTCEPGKAFMKAYPSSKWRLHTNCPETELVAAHAHAMYEAM